MNTMHTPTPWAEQEMPGGCNDRITDTDGEGKTICEFPYGLDANSAFIVKACNAHDDLVAALRSARKNFWIVREYAKGVNVQHAIEEIDTALAKAGA